MTGSGTHGRAATQIVQMGDSIALQGYLVHPFSEFELSQKVQFQLDTGSPTSIVPRELFEAFATANHALTLLVDKDGLTQVRKLRGLTGGGFDANRCLFGARFIDPGPDGLRSEVYRFEAAVRCPPQPTGGWWPLRKPTSDWKQFPRVRNGAPYILLGLDFIAASKRKITLFGHDSKVRGVLEPR